jgi:hypothetical protein
MAKHQSTNTFTFSTMAFGTGHISGIRITSKGTATHIAVVAKTAHAVSTLPGPAVFLISPSAEKIVAPIMPLIAMTYALCQ